jgi:phage terminase large subunit-like protein
LDDRSGRYSPQEWARYAIALAQEWEADRIIAEVNQGGDMVEQVLRTVQPNVSYRAVRASRGKVSRAEPVSALYEQKKVFHCGRFPELETQMSSFEPEISRWSPDRMDALVYALTDLMLHTPRELTIKKVLS